MNDQNKTINSVSWWIDTVRRSMIADGLSSDHSAVACRHAANYAMTAYKDGYASGFNDGHAWARRWQDKAHSADQAVRHWTDECLRVLRVLSTKASEFPAHGKEPICCSCTSETMFALSQDAFMALDKLQEAMDNIKTAQAGGGGVISDKNKTGVLVAVFDEFRHLDRVFRESETSNDPIDRICSKLWAAVAASQTDSAQAGEMSEQNGSNTGTPLVDPAGSDGWYIRWVLDSGTCRRDYVRTEEELLDSFRHATYNCGARSVEISCDPNNGIDPAQAGEVKHGTGQ